MRLIAIFHITFKLFWICSPLLLNRWELMKRREQRHKIFQFTTAEIIKLFITQCIFVYIECHYQDAFISWCLCQIAYHLLTLNRLSHSLGNNLRITLDVFTFIHTSIESRTLLSVLLQFPDEYKKIISLIANSCTIVSLLSKNWFLHSVYFVLFTNGVLLILCWTSGIFILLYSVALKCSVFFYSLIFHVLSQQLVSLLQICLFKVS